MKVLMIGSHLRTTGGITTVIKNYLKAGLNDKVDLTFFPTYYGSNHSLNILYFIIQYFKLFSLLFIVNSKMDIAHIHMSYKGSFTRKKLIIDLLYKKRIPIVLHMHGSQFKEFYSESNHKKKLVIQNTLNKTSLILALGESWRKYYQSISSTRVESLDNAVFPKVMNDLREPKYFITCMGVLSVRKGSYDLIEVAKRIKGKINSNYRFLLAGDGEIENVKLKISEAGVSDLFIIPGWISDEKKIEEIYRKSVIYVLPSYNEGMPMSILEAMSYGLPIISTNIGSIPKVVNESNGFLIEPGDIDDLERKILTLLNEDSKLELLKVNNIKKINGNYNIYNSIDKLISLYIEVINYK